MQRLNALVLSVLAVTALACAPSCLPDSQGGGVDWPKVAKCGPSVDDVVGAVERVLLSDGTGGMSDRAKSELEQLAQKHGANTIACLVDLLIQQWTSPGAAQLPERIAAAGRGRGFLSAEGVERVDRTSGSP